MDIPEVDLTSQLRQPVLREHESTLPNLVVQMWHNRAESFLSTLHEVGKLSPRLAADGFIVSVALVRFAKDAPHAGWTSLLSNMISNALKTENVELWAYVASSVFDLDALLENLAAYVAEVGSPLTFEPETSAWARELIEAMDDVLLFEEVTDFWGQVVPEPFLNKVQQCAAAFAQAAPSLVPAQAFIRATASTLDPHMTVAANSYPMWLALMEARGTWAVSKVFIEGFTQAFKNGQ